MAHVLLDSSEQGIVVFKLWKSLRYSTRLFISFGIIMMGFILQYALYTLLPGIVFIFLGNLLLLPSGYTNRINLGKFDPETDWERVEKYKLDELLNLDRKIRRWDRSSIDVSNALGGIVFFILLAIAGIIGITAFEMNNQTMQIITVDAAALLLPYWVTGLRSVFTVPKLTMKIKLVNTLLTQVETQLNAHRVNYYLLLKGKDQRIPQDIKFKVDIANQDPDFLGFYGQITINSINSSVFPYFYVVLVAKKGFGLQPLYQSYSPHKNYVKEFPPKLLSKF